MIIQIIMYARTVTCIRNDKQFEEQDVLLRKAARLAIHAPSSVRNDYVYRAANLRKSKSLTKDLARRYILELNRSRRVRDMVATHCTDEAANLKTPLDIIDDSHLSAKKTKRN